MQRVGQSFKIFFRPFAPGQLWAGFLPRAGTECTCPGGSSSPIIGACGVCACAARCWTAMRAPYLRHLHAPFTCAICMRQYMRHYRWRLRVPPACAACARPPRPPPLLPEKQGVKAAARIWGLNAVRFHEARCAALTVNSIGRRYFGKPGEKKPGLRRTAEDFARRHEIFYIYFFHCVLYAWARIAEPAGSCLTGQSVTSRVCRAVLPMTFARCMQAMQEPPSPYAAFRARATSQLRRFQ